MLRGVPSNEIEFVWPLVAPLVESACSRFGATMGSLDILTACKSCDMQLWVYWNNDQVKAVGVTEIITHPRFRAANLVICTGYDHKEWNHVLTTLEEWARENGCERMRLLTRPGWERVLTDYKKTHVVLEKEI